MAVKISILPPRFRRPELIGRGGMGDIYRATDSVLGRVVAIKILAERFAQDTSVRERFTREALSAARLSGEPNTVTIYDVGEHDDRPYIVMEHLSGGSLDDVLRDGGPQPPERVFTWLEEAARALDVAHREGVVHRDVKPANLMLDGEGNVHVADFGIASSAGMDSLTMTGTVLGTAGYLSPEQAQGERAGPASDRYALGIVAWELFTGQAPLRIAEPDCRGGRSCQRADSRRVCSRRSTARARSRVRARAGKGPAERYGTAGEFVAALRTAFSDAAGSTNEIAAVAPPTAATRPLRGVEQVERVPYPPRAYAARNAWPLLAALLVAGAVGGALLAYFLTRDDTPPATVVTRIQRVTTQGRVTTVEKTVTVTTSASRPPTRPAPASPSGAALNNAGFRKMQAGDYAGALPLLERAVQKLQGTTHSTRRTPTTTLPSHASSSATAIVCSTCSTVRVDPGTTRAHRPPSRASAGELLTRDVSAYCLS